MSSFRRSFLFVAAAALLPACKEEAKAKPELFSDMCAQIFDCGCREFPYDDVAQCQQVNAVNYAGLEASAEAAGLTVDFACLMSRMPVTQYQCKTPSQVFGEEEEEPATCSYCSLAYGSVAAGQPCVEYEYFDDCASGLACRRGTCVDPCAPLAEGDDCWTGEGECGPGLYCDFEVGVCERPPGEGEPCYYECADGLHCDYDTSVCVKRPKAGEPCPNFVCSDGLTCTYTADADDYVCVPLPGLGEPCDLDCKEPYYCSYDFDAGTSECVERGKEGQPCDFTPCDFGLICSYDTDRCERLPNAGEPCIEGFCAEPAYCDFEVNMCKSLPGAGEPCFDGYICADGLECTPDDTCQPEQALVCEWY